MTPHANQRGVALLAVLGLVLALLPVVAAVCMQTRLDTLMQGSDFGSTQAFYAAEAGLAHAFAEIRPTASLSDLLAGPDGNDDTPDDGLFPFRSPSPADLTYVVRAIAGPANTVRLQSSGHGLHDAVRQVEMIVAPSDTPFTPGALYVEANRVDLDLGSSGFSISGMANGDENRSAVAGVAVTSAVAAASLQAAVPPSQVAGARGAPSIVATSPLDLDSYSVTLRRRLDAVIDPAPPSGPALLGTPANPRLSVIDADWRMTEDTEGFGILIVGGDLDVRAGFRYSGLLIVAGKLRSTEGTDFRLQGALWLRDDSKAQIDLRGTGFIRYDPGRLRQTAAVLEDALLYLPEVVGWREIS